MISCVHHQGMTTDILLHSEHGDGCPSGFITNERENKENLEEISKGRKYVQQNRVVRRKKKRVRKPINQAKKLKNESR